ncbi:enoyl-CoA hydratase/isomerase family protein [Streptomyces sp. NPDC050164]|uniref:enoyl-CoA hydratase/isomerase family protein n=1 Tax=Streptomyces sp. NPDC050164 TaxID=3365605 RepID=UPI0037A5E248
MTSLDHQPLPALTFRGFTADAPVFTRHVLCGEKILARLPDKPLRSADQQQTAQEIHRTCRELRARFVATYADELYDRLTDGHRRTLRPAQLAAAAAEELPGLVPDSRHMEQERRRTPRHREGREIDQGVLFWGLLRASRAGRHLLGSALTPTPRSLAVLPEFRAAGTADLGTVRVTRDDTVGHVTLCNTRCLNAEDDALVGDLETAVDLVLLEERIRVCVLRGGRMKHPRYEGRRVFSSGINLTDLYHGRISFVDFLLGRELGLISKMMHGLRLDERPGPESGLAKPWVAAVDSFAIGGGMQLLLTLDRVIAEEGAYFRLPAAQEGIVPGAASLRLGRLTGGRMARRIVLFGETIHTDAEEARLLCDEVVPTEAVDRAIERAAADLGSSAVTSNRRMLHLAEEPADAFRAYMAAFSWEQSHRMYSPDVLDTLERTWMRRRRRN